jgi:hypothetical protein
MTRRHELTKTSKYQIELKGFLLTKSSPGKTCLAPVGTPTVNLEYHVKVKRCSCLLSKKIKNIGIKNVNMCKVFLFF